MSDPTYRIDADHSPGNLVPWMASIVRLSDESVVQYIGGDSAEDAISKAQVWLAAYNTKQPDFSVYVDDDGRPVEGHSVKA